ncbi:MAG: hypothetical protein WBG43_06160, partial [Marinifilaceae bacterium]
ISPNATDINGLIDTEVYLFNRNGMDLEWIDEALTDTSLESNALYTYKYKAKDILKNTSDYSLETSKHTLASDPVNVEKGKVTQTTLEIKLQEGENKKAPEYRLEVKLQGTGTDGENKAISEWTPGETKEFQNLSVDDVYEVWLQTRNADKIENDKYKALDGVKLNTPPIITVENIDNKIFKDGLDFTLSGTIKDQEKDTITIKAIVNGIEKTITIDTNISDRWSLTWNTSELSEGKYSDIEVIANDSNITSSTKWSNSLIVDKTAPSKPTIKANIETPTNQNITIAIIGGTQYRINNGEWQEYKESFIVAQNCNIEAKVSDEAGNTSIAVKTINNIDKTPPAPPIIKLSTEELTNKDITITISGGSQYKIDNGQWQSYKTPFTVSQNCQIQSTVSDGVGNTSIAIKTINNIDKIPPAPPVINVTPESVKNRSVTVTIDGAYQYKLENQWLTTKNANHNSFEVNKNCTVEAKAIDEAGNSAIASKVIKNIDRTPPKKPEVNIKPKTTTYGDVEIIAKGGDLISVDGGKWINYKSPFKVSENCKVKIKAVDEAGNESITEKVINNIKEPSKHNHKKRKDDDKSKNQKEETIKVKEIEENISKINENIYFIDIKGH